MYSSYREGREFVGSNCGEMVIEGGSWICKGVLGREDTGSD